MTGRHETAHFLTSTGSVSWEDEKESLQPPGRVKLLYPRKEELMFAPVKVLRTTSKHIVGAILFNLETLCGGRFGDFIHQASNHFDVIQISVCADGATANVRLAKLFFAWFLSKQNMLTNKTLLLGTFHSCLLHQMARVLVLNLNHQGDLSNKLFSVSRFWDLTGGLPALVSCSIFLLIFALP